MFVLAPITSQDTLPEKIGNMYSSDLPVVYGVLNSCLVNNVISTDLLVSIHIINQNGVRHNINENILTENEIDLYLIIVKSWWMKG